MRSISLFSALLSVVAFISPVQGVANNSACLVCNFKFSPQATQKGEASPCDDLFAAACLKPDGDRKYEGLSRAQRAERENLILKARNEASKKNGYADFTDEMKTTFQKELGLELKDDLSERRMKDLLDPGSWLDSEDFFKDPEACETQRAGFEGVNFYEMDVPQLKAELGKRESFIKTYKEKSIRYQARDIPSFVSDTIGKSCENYKASGSPSKDIENPQLKEVCPNIERVKREAIDLYRSEGEEGYRQKAEAFVRKYDIPSFQDSGFVAQGYGISGSSEDQEAEMLRSQLNFMNSNIYNVCRDFSSVVRGAVEDVRAKLYESNSLSKTTVENLIGSTYTAARKKQMDAIFASTREDIQGVVKEIVRDPAKRSLIVDGYDSVGYFWLEKPPASAYRQRSGDPILDTEKISEQSDLQYFTDSSLSFFSQLNAFYSPQSSRGRSTKQERINIQPGMLEFLDDNPYAVLSVVAHELGHKIDPEMGQLNGHDMSPEYREVLACYKDSKSIKMVDRQKGEAIADFISSEVLARQIAKLPPDKRQQAVLSSMQDLCFFHDDRGNSISCTGSHPDPSLRIGGIYGANPNLRKVMGCEKDSPRFKTCGLSSVATVEMSGGPRESTGGPARIRRGGGAQ